jgi:heme/copper-type cytochrome/quinol oxidase subunit 2
MQYFLLFIALLVSVIAWYAYAKYSSYTTKENKKIEFSESLPISVIRENESMEILAAIQGY